MNWLKGLGIALLGFLAILAGMKVGREKRRAENAEYKAQELLATGVEKNLEKAQAQNLKAKAHKKAAKDAAEKAKARLDKVGAKDEDVSSVISAWNKRRLHD